jgi:xylulokinase
MAIEQYLLGLDIGSSSVKASLVAVSTGQAVATAQSPHEEMPMTAHHPGWAEQDPEMWWTHVVTSTLECLRRSDAGKDAVVAIGIAYQMHGLVVTGKDQKPLRPAIIWCDSRAVSIGAKAQEDLGELYCHRHFLNSPGNFTASKLKWVQTHEPAVFGQVRHAMLPGDYIALKLTGEATTTDTGLSEGIFWDFEEKAISRKLLAYYGIDPALLPRTVAIFGEQGKLRREAADQLGLSPGITIAYRAGDQPNNAFSLNVLNPGEMAATAGTSGVIYGVTDQNANDRLSRVNTFLHVNNTANASRNGVLLCVNGTGIQNSWLRRMTQAGGVVLPYDSMNTQAATVPVGSEGITVLPFGNGAERMLVNRQVGGSVHGLNFNTHTQAHLFRAGQEGIVFALKYGFDILREMGLHPTVIRAGHSNMFLSPVFREAFVNTIGAPLELYDTDGAKGAALGAGIGAKVFGFLDAFKGLNLMATENIDAEKKEQYEEAFLRWNKTLSQVLNEA